MSKNIIGFFDDKDQAEQAKSQLIAIGIEDSNIKMFSGRINEETRPTKNASKKDEPFFEKIKHFFTNMNEWGATDEADTYAEGIRRGGITLSVTVEEARVNEVSEILDQCGAIDTNRKAEFYKESGFSKYAMDSKPYTSEESLANGQEYKSWEKNRYSHLDNNKVDANLGNANLNDNLDTNLNMNNNLDRNLNANSKLEGRNLGNNNLDNSLNNYDLDNTLSNLETPRDNRMDRNVNTQADQVIPVIEENINAGKRAIERGRVRIYTRITETPIDQELHLRDEHVEVQRVPVDRPVQTADMAAFKEGEINLKETSEEAVVSKEARVVEEVRIRKEADERIERIHDTAKRTDVEVERTDDLNLRNSERSNADRLDEESRHI